MQISSQAFQRRWRNVGAALAPLIPSLRARGVFPIIPAGPLPSISRVHRCVSPINYQLRPIPVRARRRRSTGGLRFKWEADFRAAQRLALGSELCLRVARCRRGRRPLPGRGQGGGGVAGGGGGGLGPRGATHSRRRKISSFSSGSLVCNAVHRERSTIDRQQPSPRRDVHARLRFATRIISRRAHGRCEATAKFQFPIVRAARFAIMAIVTRFVVLLSAWLDTADRVARHGEL